jgi:hypothetical protein
MVIFHPSMILSFADHLWSVAERLFYGSISLINASLSCAYLSSSSIIEELKKSQSGSRKSQGSNLVYFYFAFDDIQKQDLGVFLRSALEQLCPRDGMLPQLDDLYHVVNQAYLQQSNSNRRSSRSFVLSAKLERRHEIPIISSLMKNRASTMLAIHISSWMHLMRCNSDRKGTPFSNFYD